MKKVVCLLLVAVFLVMAAQSYVRAADVIKLKAANYLPVTHPMSVLTAWFCDEVKKRTNGLALAGTATDSVLLLDESRVPGVPLKKTCVISP